MLSEMFGIMPNAHLGFGDAMQGAMDSMWKVNSANQQAALAQQALGGAGGSGGMSRPSPWDAYFGFNLSQPGQAAAFGGANNEIRKYQNQNFQDQLGQEKQRRDLNFNDLQRKIPLLSSLFGFNQSRFRSPGTGGGFGYNTNFGASGSYAV